jgi:hypothetical protein
MNSVESIERQIDQLSKQEREQLLAYLLQSPTPKHTTINKLRGTIKLTVDPLEYQQTARQDR